MPEPRRTRNGPRKIAILPGDGVGPEVTAAATQALEALGGRYSLNIQCTQYPVGWAGIQEAGAPLPAETLAGCRNAHAVFLGAVGHPDADHLPPAERPEAGLLALRRELDCYANLRPAKAWSGLEAASPLRSRHFRGTDLMMVRELSSGLYYGEPRWLRPPSGEQDGEALNTMRYAAQEVRRVAEVAFQLARTRKGKVTSVDKANVLETSRLWRDEVTRVAQRFPEVELEHMLVDRAAMELVVRPGHFDVLLTENLFGDILSDEAAGVVGSLGLLPSASLGTRAHLYEPVHGSAPDIAGKDRANPVAALLSMAMLLEFSLREMDAARALENAVCDALATGIRTADLAAAGGPPPVGTEEFTRAVLSRIHAGQSGGLFPRRDAS